MSDNVTRVRDGFAALEDGGVEALLASGSADSSGGTTTCA